MIAPTAAYVQPAPHCATPFSAPAVTSAPQVPYPESAREQGLGKVTVYVVVSTDAAGNVLRAAVSSSSGSLSIDQTARMVALNTSFAPAIVQCVPVSSIYLDAVAFDPASTAPYSQSWRVGVESARRLVLAPTATQTGNGNGNATVQLSGAGSTMLAVRYTCPQGTSGDTSRLEMESTINHGPPSEFRGFDGGFLTEVIYGTGAATVQIVTPCTWTITTLIDPALPPL